MQCKCGQEAGKSKFVNVEYKGLIFRHTAKDSQTCLGCLRKETAEFYEENSPELISITDGKIRVNWEFLGKSSGTHGHYRRIVLLERLGVISAERSGNFVFEPDNLNIRVGYSERYAFTRLEDIIEYGRVVLGNKTFGDWSIRMAIEKTLLTMEDALGLK